MSAERARLLNLAASVADGSADIDWESLEASLHDDEDRQLLRDLKVLAGVADVHRSNTVDIDQPRPSKVVGRIRPVDTHELPTIEEGVLPAPERGPLEHWGHLALLEQIGQGSFGHVYRARDTRLDRDVALKLLRPGRRTSELAGKMLHEGRILARVRHRNVVTVFGAEEREGRVGLWMEYIRGRTLEQLLRSQGAFGAREVALIGQELCRALAAVHKAGLVHRDIKAQNVMREEGGRLVLMDFGAGQVVQADGASSGGRLTGTPLYLAPELLRGEDATVQSDIYSLGVVLFHLVTSQYPVAAASLDDLRQAHAEGRRLRLHDARPDVADDVARVVERALQPDPRRRYASAGAMQDALARSLGLDSTITVERPPRTPAEEAAAPQPVEQGTPRLRRWWTVAAVGFGLGAALAAGLAVVWPGTGTEPVVRRAAVRVPVVAVRPMVGAIADPLTAALATDLAQALRTSADVRVTSEEAVSTLNRPGDLSRDIMGALQADAVVEVLPVSRRAGSYYANVRVVMAGAVAATLVPDGPSPDLPALTGRILTKLAPRLRIDAQTLRPVSARSQLGAAHPEASQRYMRGSWLLAQGANEVLPDAGVEFHAALTLDPEFAPAYARWAQTLMRRYRAGQITAADAFDRARTAVAQALARDSENSDAFAVAADLRAEEERDWVRAEDDFLRAIALNPSNEYARTRYAMLLSGRGRTTEAVDQMEEARRLAPLSSTLQGYLGMTLHYAGRDDEALRLFEQLHKVDPEWGAAVVGLCRVYTSVGKYAEAALACAEVERRQTEQQAFVDAQRAAIVAGQGRTGEARVIADRLARRYGDAPPDERADLAFYTAVAQVALQHFDQAFLWLDTAMDERSSRLLYVRIDPRFTALRSDPRFASLVARVDQGL
jgi:eukaryotic-like serine/threonine-protein kinase